MCKSTSGLLERGTSLWKLNKLIGMNSKIEMLGIVNLDMRMRWEMSLKEVKTGVHHQITRITRITGQADAA